MSVTKGLLVRFEALPGKEDDVKEFLDSGRALVEDEQATTAWFAIRLGPSSFGIFDVFPDDAGATRTCPAQLRPLSASRRANCSASRRSRSSTSWAPNSPPDTTDREYWPRKKGVAARWLRACTAR